MGIGVNYKGRSRFMHMKIQRSPQAVLARGFRVVKKGSGATEPQRKGKAAWHVSPA